MIPQSVWWCRVCLANGRCASVSTARSCAVRHVRRKHPDHLVVRMPARATKAQRARIEGRAARLFIQFGPADFEPVLPAGKFLVIMNFSGFLAARRAMGPHVGLILTDAPELVSVNDEQGAAAAIPLLRRVLGTLEGMDAERTVLERYGA